MSSLTLDAVAVAFEQWRASRPDERKTAIPDTLRQQVLRLLQYYPRSRVAQVLGVNYRQIRKWQQLWPELCHPLPSVAVKSPADAEPHFIRLEPTTEAVDEVPDATSSDVALSGVDSPAVAVHTGEPHRIRSSTPAPPPSTLALKWTQQTAHGSVLSVEGELTLTQWAEVMAMWQPTAPGLAI